MLLAESIGGNIYELGMPAVSVPFTTTRIYSDHLHAAGSNSETGTGRELRAGF